MKSVIDNDNDNDGDDDDDEYTEVGCLSLSLRSNKKKRVNTDQTLMIRQQISQPFVWTDWQLSFLQKHNEKIITALEMFGGVTRSACHRGEMLFVCTRFSYVCLNKKTKWEHKKMSGFSWKGLQICKVVVARSIFRQLLHVRGRAFSVDAEDDPSLLMLDNGSDGICHTICWRRQIGSSSNNHCLFFWCHPVGCHYLSTSVAGVWFLSGSGGNGRLLCGAVSPANADARRGGTLTADDTCRCCCWCRWCWWWGLWCQWRRTQIDGFFNNLRFSGPCHHLTIRSTGI